MMAQCGTTAVMAMDGREGRERLDVADTEVEADVVSVVDGNRTTTIMHIMELLAFRPEWSKLDVTLIPNCYR